MNAALVDRRRPALLQAQEASVSWSVGAQHGASSRLITPCPLDGEGEELSRSERQRLTGF